MLEMTTDEITTLLDTTLIGRLCMADDRGQPYAIPLPYCWIDNALYLRLPDSGRKAAILAGNNRVCFEVDTFTPTLDQYASVLIEGRLEWVTSVDEKQRVKLANTAKYTRLRNGHRPGHGRATPLANLPLRKLTPTHLTGRKR
jgi:nitroimidazol reductase NimA-like FMN-containing flavoprotein (pyridoxamine 5'-phosphate oxidase superfamily)